MSETQLELPIHGSESEGLYHGVRGLMSHGSWENITACFVLNLDPFLDGQTAVCGHSKHFSVVFNLAKPK